MINTLLQLNFRMNIEATMKFGQQDHMMGKRFEKIHLFVIDRFIQLRNMLNNPLKVVIKLLKILSTIESSLHDSNL